MVEDTGNWYYAEKGEKVGPLNLGELKNLIEIGKVEKETTVWDGEGDWKPAYKTALSEFLKGPANVPPPLAGADVYNGYVWTVAAIPVIGSILELMLIGILGGAATFLYLIPNVVLCILDEKKLKGAGHKAPSSWWCLLIPVYLWKRATFLKQRKNYFWGWGAAFVISIFISTIGNEVAVEDAACPLVTEIVQNQFFGSASCKAVTIDEEVTTGFYKATAILDNGNELFITIEEAGDEEIYVRIPNQ